MIITNSAGGFNPAAINTAAYHNSVPRFKDITSYYTDGSLWNRINGTNDYKLFDDIYLGDYFQMSRAVSAYEQTQTYQTTGSDYVTIAGFDIMKSNGDTSLATHHIVCVPGQGEGGTQHFGRSRMNSTNTTSGGYVGSEMYTTTIGAVTSTGSTATTASINEQLYAEFGSHLLTSREILSNTMNASVANKMGRSDFMGASGDWSWYSCQAVLMSEVEVYGATVFSSSGYDTGTAKMQLPLFALSRGAMNNRSSYYWLKDVACATSFCLCSGAGLAAYSYASRADHYVRPRFLLS